MCASSAIKDGGRTGRVLHEERNTEDVAGKTSAVRGGARQLIRPHTRQEEPAQPAP